MSYFFSSIKGFTVLLLLACTAHLSVAQTSSSNAPSEAGTVQSYPSNPGPISHNYTLKKVDGTLNILVDSDGSYVFSGNTKPFPGKDFDITLGLKNSTGAVVLFEYVGDASHGIQFSKQGKSQVLKDNFASFASSHKATWQYRYYESAAGKRAEYEKREQKRKELEKKREELEKEISTNTGINVSNLDVTAGQMKSYDEWRNYLLSKHWPVECPDHGPSATCKTETLILQDKARLGFKSDAEALAFEKMQPKLQKETGAKAFEAMQQHWQQIQKQVLQQQEDDRANAEAEAQLKLNSMGLGGPTTVGSVMDALGTAAKDIFSFL